MKRVMIIGQPGSGKSTLAARLGAKTGLPVYHIDREVHWLPGWIERNPDEKAALCSAIHAKEEWIFEGGHSKTWPERAARADTIIWLDFPLWLRFWRVIKRTFRHHGKTRPDLADNCPEQFNPTFFKWIWDTRKTGRNSALRIFNDPPADTELLHHTTPSQVSIWIAHLGKQDAKRPSLH